MEDLLVQLLVVVVQVVLLAVGGYVVSFLKSKIGVENYNKYYEFAKKSVTAVEQLLGPGNGEDKKEEVLQLVKKSVGNKLTNKQIETLIEAAVFEMNLALKNKMK